MCRSNNFQKSVIYLSEIGQKTASYKNMSENCLTCVSYVPEICHFKKILVQSDIRQIYDNCWTCIGTEYPRYEILYAKWAA